MDNDVSLQALLKRLEELEARVRELQGQPPGAPVAAAAAVAAPVAAAAAQPQELSADVLVILSGAIAAFLGVKARIKQVRLAGRDVWVQQGRASIMASHRVTGRG